MEEVGGVTGGDLGCVVEDSRFVVTFFEFVAEDLGDFDAGFDAFSLDD